ncbi:MAD2 mitotic arrest deficient-like 2 [Mactra antiquata]
MDTNVNVTQVSSSIFAEFLEVSLHLILYNRGLYPAGVFERRRKYNVPVQMCLHPEVTGYITKVIDSVKVMVASGGISMVTFVVLDPAANPVERFVFEMGEASTEQSSDKYLFRLEDALRGFILKLNVADSLLKPLPPNCTWVIHVHTKESTADEFIQARSFQDFAWVPADRRQTCMDDPVLVPLKTSDNPMLKMQLYVEESGRKCYSGPND